MPKLVVLEEIKEGMELALPIKNKFGQVLLSADVRLENKHKKILKTWGVTGIYIKEDNIETNEAEYDDKAVSEAAQILSRRLKWKPTNFNEEDLYNMALRQILEKNN